MSNKQLPLNTLDVLQNHVIITKTDLEGRITYVNDKFCEATEYSVQEAIGKCHKIVRHPDVKPIFFKKIWETIQNGDEFVGLMKNKTKSGKDLYLQTLIYPEFKDGSIVGYCAVRTDITDMYYKSNVYDKLMSIDSLTGLGNYVALLNDLKASEGKDVFLAFINIAGFGDINSVFSHDAGDALLKKVAKKISQIFRNFKVYRKNGDVFAILRVKSESDNECKIEKFEEHIKKQVELVFSEPFVVRGNDISLDFTVSVAHGNKGEAHYKECEIALAKGRCNYAKYSIFTKDMELNVVNDYRKNSINLKFLKYGLENNTIVPYFQPIVNNKTFQIEKYECLARLIKDDGGVMNPAEFLEISKKAKKYEMITEIMIMKSFDYFTKKGVDVEFSLNLNAKDLLSNRVRAVLISCISNLKSPSNLVIEVLEDEDFVGQISHISFGDDSLSGFLHKLKMMGAKIAIDDFGTGYSNWSRLSQINADYVKIDGSLISQLENGGESLMIVEGIVDTAKKLGLKTIAEFVSSEQIFNIVRDLGIDYSQGYFLGKPIPDIVSRLECNLSA